MATADEHGRRTRKKKKKDKARREAAETPAAPVLAPAGPAAAGVSQDRPGRPPGQWLFDMPFSSVAPRLIKPELGLHNLVARAGENAAYEIDVTLLDAPDHRLIRSGVLLAHRVVDGRGEWFLTAPDWQPLLPKDRIELMGHADLPDELASLLRPLRRRATLGPVAGLFCERREFALRDDSGTTLALLRDDKVTVRRGGLTTARYREVMLTPVGPGLTGEQRGFVDRAFASAGANRVPRFPRLVTRLGAPATGPSDIPEPQPYDGAASLRRFVAAVLGRRLREIVRDDLAVRGGDLDGGVRLGEQCVGLRAELVGLSDALDPHWVEDLVDDLDWLAQAAAAATDGLVAVRVRSERYLALLERLVAATRSPRLRVDGSQPAGVALDGLIEAATARLVDAAAVLGQDTDDATWDAVRTRLAVLTRLAAVAEPVVGAHATRTVRLLDRPGRLLDAVPTGHDETRPDLTGLDAAQAFEAGRAYERGAERALRARHDFVERWEKTARKLGR